MIHLFLINITFFLPFGSDKTLSYNIRMFDCLVAKAIDSAIEVKGKGEL